MELEEARLTLGSPVPGGISPFLVAIAGGSCAGKSWLAERLQTAFGKAAGRLSLDAFYLDRSHLPEPKRATINFDHPRAIDWPSVRETVNSFKHGRNARAPRYDFKTHSRTGEEQLGPKPIIIMDGLWLLRRREIRQLFDLKIFLQCDMDLCEQRRLQRDTLERGRGEHSIREQFRTHVLPMYLRYVAPQARWADALVQSPPAEETIERLIDRIRIEQAQAATKKNRH